MTQRDNLQALRRAFPDAQGGIKTYITAYGAFLHATPEMRRLALKVTQRAWSDLTDDERAAVDAALDRPLQVA